MWFLFLSLIVAGADSHPKPHRKSSTSTLSPAESIIVKFPFAPLSSRALLQSNLSQLLARHNSRLLLPKMSNTDNSDLKTMGWKLNDLEYWRSIPSEARSIPPRSEWEKLPNVTYTNSQLGGKRTVWLYTQGNYDKWLLSDPRHELTACISVERLTKRAYFMEISQSRSAGHRGKWEFHEAFDNCYSCHASGPRIIRPLEEQGVAASTLATFNTRLLAYKACDFNNNNAVDETKRGTAIADSDCTICHDGKNRGKLYSIHRPTISFKTSMERTMPVAVPAPAE